MPGITAMFSALLGMWNDRKASEDDYFTALGHIALANLEALARIRADRDRPPRPQRPAGRSNTARVVHTKAW